MQRPWRVIGIDAGWKNLAICAIDAGNYQKPVHWQLYTIMEPPYIREKFLGAVQRFFEREDVKTLLRSADLIVLERQLQEKYACLNCKVRFEFWENTIEVHPSTVGKQYGLSKDRKSKKKEAVVLAQKNAVFPRVKGKKDDLADAFLMAMYGLQQKHKIEGWKSLEDGERNRRPDELPVLPRKPQRSDSQQHPPFAPTFGGFQTRFF